MILVNEEASKILPDLAKSNYKLSLLDQSGKKILKIKKILDAGIATDNIMTTTVRLFIEASGAGTVAAEKVEVYKFDNVKFTKLNSLFNETPLPINGSFSGNGFIDIPIGTTDEEVDITLAFTGNVTKLYAAINGYIHNLSDEVLEKLKPETSISFSKDHIYLLKDGSTTFNVTTNANTIEARSTNINVATVSVSGKTVTVESLNKVSDCEIEVIAREEGKQETIKSIKLNVVKPPKLEVSVKELSMLVAETEVISITKDSLASIDVNIDRNDVIEFNKETNTITSKSVVTEGTDNEFATLTLTPSIGDIRGESTTIKVKVTPPYIKLSPSNPLLIYQDEKLKLDIELSKDTTYRYIEKRRDRVTWDDNTKELVAGSIVTSGTNFPYSYVEFYPQKGGVEGKMVYAEVEVTQAPTTELSITPNNPEMWEGDALTISVYTDADDFTFRKLDEKLQVTREGNTLKLQSTQGTYGRSQIELRASRPGVREAVLTVNVNIKDHSRITISPDDRDITLEVGQAKLYRCTYNTTQGNSSTRYVHLRKTNNNVREQAHSANEFSFIGASVGQCQLTLYGTKWGSHYTEVVINANVIPAPVRPVEVDKIIVSIPSVNQTATVTLTDASNMNVQSTDRNVATSVLSGNTLTITGIASGIAHIRLWRTGQESGEVRVKVLVAKPTVLINNRLDPLWTRGPNVNVQHPAVTYQNGADDYDFEIENPDQLEYNKANRTIRTKGTLVRGEIYKIKIIPKVQGVRQNVETCSYLQIKGQ